MQQSVMRWKLLLCGVFALAGSLGFAADLKVDAQPAFIGYGQMSGVMPLAVTVRNVGDDARGMLHVSSGSFQMDYPIELPRGAVKRLLAYPQVEYAGEVVLDLSTNRGDVHSVYRQFISSEMGSQNVLLIGETQGDLSFFKQRREDGSGAANKIWDCYVKPADTPDRSTAFVNLAAVVLGSGAERLPDGAVRALHLYVQTGGTLVFLGGASAPVLTDHRWDDIAPISPRLPKTLPHSAFLDELTSSGPGPGPISIIGAVAHPSATVQKEGQDILLARRDIGLGKTVCMTFNPLEEPLTRWPFRRQLFEKALRTIDSARAFGYLSDFSSSTPSENPYGRYYTPYSSAYASPYGYSEDEAAPGDPFSTRLPPLNKVAGILAAYFVVILPINFLLLKKLKKGELAWFTAPLISVAFAGAFFAAAKDLYSAKLSAATQGLLVASNVSPETVFVGRSQLFFPQGGQYDLKMDGLESIGSGADNDSYRYGYGRQEQRGLEDVNPVDVGQIKIPHMDVNNLAFREISYRQILPVGKWLETELIRTGGTNVLKVTNLSRYRIDSATAIVAGQSFGLKSLEPGNTVKINLPDQVTPETNPAIPPAPSYSYSGNPYEQTLRYTDLAEFATSTKEIVIKASIQGVPVGPGIGEIVQARQSVELAYFTGLHYGRPSL